MIGLLDFFRCRRPKTRREKIIEDQMKIIGYKNPAEYFEKLIQEKKKQLEHETVIFIKRYERFPYFNTVHQFVDLLSSAYYDMNYWRMQAIKSKKDQKKTLNYSIIDTSDSFYHYHFFPCREDLKLEEFIFKDK
jgi:hypothetical protein